VSAKPKEVLTEEQMDELVRPSEKEESEDEEKSEDEDEPSKNRSFDGE
jgi:hypothetical protein